MELKLKGAANQRSEDCCTPGAGNIKAINNTEAEGGEESTFAAAMTRKVGLQQAR